MGAVYAIDHELTRHKRALKLLHPSAQLIPDIVRRFLNEASAAGRAGNPHLVETFDAGSLPTGEPYLVMELLDGETLGAIIRREHALDPSLAAELVGQAAEGIEAAHRAGIIHRDLKPENLFVTTRDGRPFIKIMDFGVSKFASESPDSVRGTKAGMVYGSPAYMSPEQFSGRADIDGRTDVFALGIVLFECLTGDLPFEGSTIQGLMAKVFAGEMRPIESMRPGLAPALVEVVHRALAPNRDERILTARALADALAPFRAFPALQARDPSFAATIASEPPHLSTPPGGPVVRIAPLPSIGPAAPTTAKPSVSPSSSSTAPLTRPSGPTPASAAVPRRAHALLPLLAVVALGVAAGSVLLVTRSRPPTLTVAAAAASPAMPSAAASPTASAAAALTGSAVPSEPVPPTPEPSVRPVELRGGAPARTAEVRRPGPVPTSSAAASSSAPPRSSAAEDLGLRTDNPFR
jgi:serine/threonine-protein kinase